MSTVLAFQQRRLVRAGKLSDRHVGRVVRIREVEGVLVALNPHRTRIYVALLVGGSHAIFPLALDAAVEVGPKHKEYR
ncbi:hypothetical protein ACIRN4_06225 [Pimelobacter simplex]|uniref:hypothetical protein n=1 Tax=Nocardioides simplex TaxID=2045 RepID=UPI00380B50A5